MQVALAWLLHRAPNILLIPGTSSVKHLRENLQAAALQLSTGNDRQARLDWSQSCEGITSKSELGGGAKGSPDICAVSPLVCRQSAGLRNSLP